MRIYSMTATFGKLEHETLELKPGLNLIHAPNEWGKSTWCAFLVTMLYGLDTRAKSTKTALADKERYAPWSGKPMSGRVDLNWDGRDITIERTTKGRVPMGEFRAYETDTGILIPELNGTNCGQMLLGVERSVFLRSGFIRLSDLPVTNDEALRRRLNALVTTGDESSAGDRLGKGLKDLKNRIRYNRTGLLPQVEGEIAELEGKLAEIEGLQQRKKALGSRMDTVSQWLKKLESHQTALEYEAAEADAHRVAQARQLRDEAGQRLQEWDAHCATLPPRDQLLWGLEKIGELEQEVQALEMEAQLYSGEIAIPAIPQFARNVSPEVARKKAIADAKQYSKRNASKPVLLMLGILLALLGGVGTKWYWTPGLVCCAAGAVLLTIGLVTDLRRRSLLQKLEDYYGSSEPEAWIAAMEAYQFALEQAAVRQKHQQELRQDLEKRRGELEIKLLRMTQGKGLQACKAEWAQALADWNALDTAHRDWQRAESQLKTVQAMAKTAKEPAFPDTLTHSAETTEQMISEAREELRQLESRLGQYTGRMEVLGNPEHLDKQLAILTSRQKKLEDTYAALSVAQDALVQARQELQRRFAPRIASRAKELMEKMTHGRYDRLQLGEDFSLLAGAEQEDTLQSVLWRSEGTLDQMYLALRLAVAEALAPDAPMILDDALVRFDDDRLGAALEILKEEAASKQVILFSCQSREKNVLKPQ